jgi:hypothetical protein
MARSGWRRRVANSLRHKFKDRAYNANVGGVQNDGMKICCTFIRETSCIGVAEYYIYYCPSWSERSMWKVRGWSTCKFVTGNLGWHHVT